MKVKNTIIAVLVILTLLLTALLLRLNNFSSYAVVNAHIKDQKMYLTLWCTNSALCLRGYSYRATSDGVYLQVYAGGPLTFPSEFTSGELEVCIPINQYVGYGEINLYREGFLQRDKLMRTIDIEEENE